MRKFFLILISEINKLLIISVDGNSKIRRGEKYYRFNEL